jgi:DNA-binding NarL/FixJ family response regulator
VDADQWSRSLIVMGRGVEDNDERIGSLSPPWITVALGEFDALTHHGLLAILVTDRRIEVRGDGAEHGTLEELLAGDPPRVAILDERSCEVILSRWATLAQATGFLVIAHEPSPASLAELLAAGAACIARSVSAANLLSAVHAVARGERAFASCGGRQIAPSRFETHLLTDREREVLEHLTDAKSNAEIALALKISVRTVEMHAARIFRKLSRDRRDVVACGSSRLQCHREG